MTANPGYVIQLRSPTYHVDVVVRNDDTGQFDALIELDESISKRLTSILRDGVEITADELFGQAICQELADADGRRTRRELAERIPALRDFVMRDLPDADGDLGLTGPPAPNVVEYLGVGTGLVLVDRLVSLDSSYFRRIPELRGKGRKTLDFDGTFRGSTGTAYVQIETKGRTNPGDEAAWTDITRKKNAFHDGKAPRPVGITDLPEETPTFLLGTVAEIPEQGQGTTRIVIGDPPIRAFDGDPQSAKLLQRLRFYQRALTVVQPRGALLAALSDRIGILEQFREDWRKYAERPLVNWRFGKWELAANIGNTIRLGRNDKLHGRSIFSNRPQGESGTKQEHATATESPFFFIGLHRRVLLALARQDFEELSERRYNDRYMEVEFGDKTHILYQMPSGLIVSSLLDPSTGLDDGG